MEKTKLDSLSGGWILGGIDLKIRYRRSILGPIWISLSFLITVIFLSFVWTKVFNQNIKNFIWYFSIGLLVWNFIAGVISSSYMLFTESSGILLNFNINKDILITRNIVRELWVFFHALLVLILIGVYVGPNISIQSLLLTLIGFIMVVLILFNLSYLVSILVLRYRDLKEIFSTAINLLYYVTPILWPIENLSGAEYIYMFNPFFHLVNVVRAPLINGPFWWESFLTCLVLLILVIGLKKFIQNKFDKYIALWI